MWAPGRPIRATRPVLDVGQGVGYFRIGGAALASHYEVSWSTATTSAGRHLGLGGLTTASKSGLTTNTADTGGSSRRRLHSVRPSFRALPEVSPGHRWNRARDGRHDHVPNEMPSIRRIRPPGRNGLHQRLRLPTK